MPLERELAIAGRRLEVAVFEPPAASGAPIVLLHEGLGSVSLWREFPRRLAERTGRRVAAYSRYGYGRSDVLEGTRELDYMHVEGEAIVPAVVAALELDRPILFGHSDGASIALLCASAHPGLASALVLEAPHVFVEDRSIAGIEAAKAAYLHGDLRGRLARHHRDAERTFRGWNDIWLDPRFRAWNIERGLARIVAPTLVLQGDDDEYGTAAQYRAIARALPQTRIVTFPACGHAPHRECEIAVLDAVAEFLSDLPRARAGSTAAP